MERNISVPSEVEEVTAEWLSAILEYDVDPASLTITRNAHEGKGYLSNLLRVHCRKQNSEDWSHLIIKLLPQDPFMRDVVVGQGFDKAEIQSYQTILPTLIDQVPELATYLCPYIFGKYTDHAESDPNYKSVLVLEDLKPLNYYTLDFGEILTTPQILEGIDFLAKLHFAGALVETHYKSPLNEMYPILMHDMSTKSEIFEAWIQENFPGVLDMLTRSEVKREVVEAYASLGETLKGLIGTIVGHLSDSPNIIHSDLWTNNILYNNDPGKHTKVIDWQVLMYRDATLDLGVFITSSLPAEQLTIQGVQDLVQEYFNLMQKLCKERNVPGLRRRTWEEFYGFFKTYGLAFGLVWFILSQIAVGGKNDKRLVRTYEYFYEIGVLSFLKTIKK